MPAATTTAAGELVRRGRISGALAALTGLEEPDDEARCLELECRLARGEMERANRIGERLAETAHPVTADTRRSALALGRLHAAAGRDDEAIRSLRDVADPAGEDPVDLPWRAEAALSLTRLGRRREAEELAEEQLFLARGSGSAYAMAEAIRTVAAVCASGDRRQQLREAHELTAGTYDRLAAQVATDLAGLSGLLGDRAEAVTLLRSAERYADTEDLWPLHARIRGLLDRLGETTLMPRREALALLSPAELTVARGAAGGDTNRAIAQRLGVTVKSVEWHLSHTYRKLEIAGRGELPRILRVGREPTPT